MGEGVCLWGLRQPHHLRASPFGNPKNGLFLQPETSARMRRFSYFILIPFKTVDKICGETISSARSVDEAIGAGFLQRYQLFKEDWYYAVERLLLFDKLSVRGIYLRAEISLRGTVTFDGKIEKLLRLMVHPDLKLSSELKVAIRKIIKSSPALEKHFKVMRSEVRCALTDTEYTPLAYSKDKLDGKLAHVFLADEVGAMDSYPVEAMRSSQIVLKDKLGILISTQYPTENNGLTDEIDFVKKQLDGLYEGRQHYFSLLYEPDDELQKDWQTDDNVLYQANPVALGNEDLFYDLRDKRALAVMYENKRENFLCKHCNIQYKGLGSEGYVDIIKVRECSVPEVIGFWRGRPVWLGLDLSQTDDNTAVAMVTFDDNFKGYDRRKGYGDPGVFSGGGFYFKYGRHAARQAVR